MATNFPTSLDALTNPTGSSSLTSPDHASQHADANDAIEALQAKVGVNGSAVTTSLDYKIANGILPKLNVDSGTLYVDATNNRVGINDTTPDYTLDIDNGQINVDDDNDPDYYKYARIGATSARVVSYDKNNLLEDTATVIAPGSINVESQGASVYTTVTPSSLYFTQNSYSLVIYPLTLTDSRTVVFPDAGGVVVLSEDDSLIIQTQVFS